MFRSRAGQEQKKTANESLRHKGETNVTGISGVMLSLLQPLLPFDVSDKPFQCAGDGAIEVRLHLLDLETAAVVQLGVQLATAQLGAERIPNGSDAELDTVDGLTVAIEGERQQLYDAFAAGSVRYVDVYVHDVHATMSSEP